jgi:uncharacterized protein Yka (UPF0111/DUF47 family)
MVTELTVAEALGKIGEMRKAAALLTLYAKAMTSPDRNKQRLLDKIAESADTVMECLDMLEAMLLGQAGG